MSLTTHPEVVGKFLSTLPEQDDHPYRTGPWRPQTSEWDADDLTAVHGEIPHDLDGVYLRNTENPLHPALKSYHPFDGDGMLHIVGFRDGKAFYRNRFVRTDAFFEENAAGGPLWPGIGEPVELARRDYGWGARTLMKDASSTDVVVHRGVALTSHYQCGDLYRTDPYTGEALGKEDWRGDFPSDWGVSAHPKVDERTGELLHFSYSKQDPYLRYGVVSDGGELVHTVDVPLPGPRLPHDMAFTENYVILNDFPMFWDPKLLEKNIHLPGFHRDMPSRFAVIPRRGDTSQIKWFEADPTYVLHFPNAYEDGDEIVLDGFFQGNPEPADDGLGDKWRRRFRFLAIDRMQTRLHRWRFNLVTGEVREQQLSDSFTEFGMINSAYAGRDYRYTYAATGKPGWFLFDGLVRHDLKTGLEQRISFGDGVFGSETAMAPRSQVAAGAAPGSHVAAGAARSHVAAGAAPGSHVAAGAAPGLPSSAEDDGYLVTLTTDMAADASYCLVFDAAQIEAGPVCKIRLPERISSGTHSTWAPGSDLRRWRDTDNAAGAIGL